MQTTRYFHTNDDKVDKDDKFSPNSEEKKSRFKDRKFKDKIPSKDLAKLKKGRIIVRNIPFGIDEQQLSNEFIKFGDIHEVIIPKSEDGKQKGFAFINFKKTMFAIKAVKEMNGKQLSSDKYTRTIAVDFAMSKTQYINHMYSLKKIDILNEEEANNELNKDEDKMNKGMNNELKKNKNNKDLNNQSTNSQKSNEELSDSSSSDEDELDDNELEDNELEADGDELNEQSNETTTTAKNSMLTQNENKKNLKRKNKFIEDDEQVKKPRKESNDIEEGRTVFIKNLSFETTEESLSDLMKEFGELEYSIICVDKLTERSKGTAFAKFKNKADADRCIEKAQNKDENEELFYLDGRILDVQLAVSKDQLNVKKLENEKLRDKRNLYLSKEGLIYPDSPAADGVSAEDLKKRLTLSQSKKKQLENLHYFVSKNRLCFHNLPFNFTDNDLRKLCMNELKNEKDVQILFCKIMKNKDKTTNKFSTSKGFGFVSFSTHKHALRVLRALNNNPAVFTNERRPIVEFSVENINAIKKNKQYIIKESLDLNLDDEFVNHKWAGYQSKPFGTKDKVINPLTNKRMKDKRKKLQEKIKEQKVEKREEKFNKLKKESIKMKKKRIEENRPLKKRRKNNQTEKDPMIDQEMKFLSKISNSNEDKSSSKIKKRSKLIKKKKWYS